MQLLKLYAPAGITGRSMLRRVLTHKEYLEWLRLWSCDPWGEDRADLRTGIIASASLAPWSKKGHAPKPGDFMPYTNKKAHKKQSVSEMKKIWAGIQKMLGRKKESDK